ncbi:MAG: GMP/IMP nucleotidase [Gammaproteobacteria bacterium]|nr:GMP/IMP nucleotidase [Gammaproteobacteria bacterium]MCY4268815.1 GMP/IMP nucleotidase [Gammaproteobacteria bacterium]
MSVPIPPWREIDTVLFDMDGTLLDLHFDNYFWRTLVPETYSAKHGVSFAAALALVERKTDEVYGSLDWYCLDYWARELDLEITELKRTITGRISLRPNVERFLRELWYTGRRMLLITNAHPASLEIKMNNAEIAAYFHRCISAHQLHLAKEGRGFWEKLQSLEPFDRRRAILFDDSLPVLRRASEEGVGFVYGIHQPDSQRPALDHGEFPLVRDFAELLPGIDDSASGRNAEC